MQIILMAAALAAAVGPTELRIEHAAARVVLVPARGAVVTATVQQATGLPPLTIHRDGAALVIDGGMAGAGKGGLLDIFNQSKCKTEPSTLPLVTVRAPAMTRIIVNGAVFGRVGPSDGLYMRANGCGTWAVGSVGGPLDIVVDGQTKVNLSGHATHAELKATGASAIDDAGEIGTLTAEVHGSSNIKVRLVDGNVDSIIDGSGDVTYGRPTSGKFCTLC